MEKPGNLNKSPGKTWKFEQKSWKKKLEFWTNIMEKPEFFRSSNIKSSILINSMNSGTFWELYLFLLQTLHPMLVEAK